MRLLYRLAIEAASDHRELFIPCGQALLSIPEISDEIFQADERYFIKIEKISSGLAFAMTLES